MWKHIPQDDTHKHTRYRLRSWTTTDSSPPPPLLPYTEEIACVSFTQWTNTSCSILLVALLWTQKSYKCEELNFVYIPTRLILNSCTRIHTHVCIPTYVEQCTRLSQYKNRQGKPLSSPLFCCMNITYISFQISRARSTKQEQQAESRKNSERKYSIQMQVYMCAIVCCWVLPPRVSAKHRFDDLYGVWRLCPICVCTMPYKYDKIVTLIEKIYLNSREGGFHIYAIFCGAGVHDIQERKKSTPKQASIGIKVLYAYKNDPFYVFPSLSRLYNLSKHPA